MLILYRLNQNIGKIVQWLKGISSRVMLQEFPYLRKMFWGRRFRARGYLVVGSGKITDEMVQEYIEKQEGEPAQDDSRFQLTNHEALRLVAEGGPAPHYSLPWI